MMKKIPTLFVRKFENHIVTEVTREVTKGFEWVLDGKGQATEKIDGACCALIDGDLYKRYDAKKNKHGILKQPPEGAIPCGEADPVTGHWPHWVRVSYNNPEDKWFVSAYTNYRYIKEKCRLPEIWWKDGTYEAIGPHFQGNPYHLKEDILVKHGEAIIDLADRSYEGIRDYLKTHRIEGIVFWKDGEPQCKIKRKDFGFEWPIRQK